jgi:hypothetical protein
MLNILNQMYEKLFKIFEEPSTNQDPLEGFVVDVTDIVSQMEESVLSGIIDDFISFITSGALDFEMYFKLRSHLTSEQINSTYSALEMDIMDRDDFNDDVDVPADFMDDETIKKYFAKEHGINWKKDNETNRLEKLMKGRKDLYDKMVRSISSFNDENPMLFSAITPFKPTPASLMGLMKKGVAPSDRQSVMTIGRILAGVAIVNVVRNDLLKAFLYGAAFSSPLKALAKTVVYQGTEQMAYGSLCRSKKKDENGNPVASSKRMLTYVKPGILAVVPNYIARMKGGSLFSRLTNRV